MTAYPAPVLVGTAVANPLSIRGAGFKTLGLRVVLDPLEVQASSQKLDDWCVRGRAHDRL